MMRVAIRCFRSAVQLDPRYAHAYAALADCYAILRGHGVLSARDSRAEAFEAVTRALELDGALAEAHYSMAIFTFVFERRWRTAEPSFRRAIALNPKWGPSASALRFVPRVCVPCRRGARRNQRGP